MSFWMCGAAKTKTHNVKFLPKTVHWSVHWSGMGGGESPPLAKMAPGEVLTECVPKTRKMSGQDLSKSKANMIIG